MEESQGVEVTQAGPLSQQGVDVRQTGPLPAGGTGQDQRKSCTLCLTEGLLLPQQALILHRQPAHTHAHTQTHYMFDETLDAFVSEPHHCSACVCVCVCV